jgi:hypothetical protein
MPLHNVEHDDNITHNDHGFRLCDCANQRGVVAAAERLTCVQSALDPARVLRVAEGRQAAMMCTGRPPKLAEGRGRQGLAGLILIASEHYTGAVTLLYIAYSYIVGTGEACHI